MTQAQQDRRFRESLEKRSINEGRANPVEALNKMAAQDGVTRFANDVLAQLRASAQGRRRSIGDLNSRHDGMMAKAAVAAAFDKLHPLSRRRVPASETTDIPRNERNDARDERYVTPIAPGRTYREVGDANGSMDADGETRAELFGGQGVKDLTQADMKEKLILSIEQMRALAFAKLASSRYW